MTNYRSHDEFGLFRAEATTVGTGGDTMKIFVSAPIAVDLAVAHEGATPLTYGDTEYRTTGGTPNLGVWMIWNDDTSSDIVANIASVTNGVSINYSVITLNANTWDGDTVTVYYSAHGDSSGKTLVANDVAVHEIPTGYDESGPHTHLESITRALNQRGTLAPPDYGYVFSDRLAWAYFTTVDSTGETMTWDIGDETPAGQWLNKHDISDGHNGNWHPFMLTAIRLEFDNPSHLPGAQLRLLVFDDNSEEWLDEYIDPTIAGPVTTEPFLRRLDQGAYEKAAIVFPLGMAMQQGHTGGVRVRLYTVAPETVDGVKVFLSGWCIPSYTMGDLTWEQ